MHAHVKNGTCVSMFWYVGKLCHAENVFMGTERNINSNCSFSFFFRKKSGKGEKVHLHLEKNLPASSPGQAAGDGGGNSRKME